MASSKKKQDEKHLKILREMVALAHNKQCFDCHQRGPTYINMTIGSYVCTACSGLFEGPYLRKFITAEGSTPPNVETIRQTLLSSLVKALEDRFDGDLPLFRDSSFLNILTWPEELDDYSDDEVQQLATTCKDAILSSLGTAGYDPHAVESEWARLKTELQNEPCKTVRSRKWAEMYELYGTKFPNLFVLVNFLLTLPASSVDAERGFSKRGLNPPHRVKSISMASFTPEEMDFIKSRGNEFCRKVWLGLYDNRLGNQSESREESKVKDFMTQKYERKRYYVAPTEAMIEEAKRMNESVISKTPGTRPLKSLLGENAPKIQLGNHHQASSKDVQQNFFETEDQVQNSSSSNPQTATNLFGQSDGSSQPSSNDLFSQSNDPTQQAADSLFNQQNLDTGAQLSGDDMFGQQGGTTQQSSNDLFALGGNETTMNTSVGNGLFSLGGNEMPLSQPTVTTPSTAMNQPIGNDLFSGAPSQPGLDLFASNTNSNQSVSNSLFASVNTAAPVPEASMFGSTTGSQLQQENLFAAGSSSVQQPGASLFLPSSSSVAQPPAMFDGASMASLSLNTTSTGGATSPFGFGGQLQGQGQTSSMFTLDTSVSLTTGSATDVQAQNPFSTGGQGQDLFQGQGIQSSGGQQITGSISQPDLFSGISTQGQGQFSNSGNQGITMETNPFGGAVLPSGVEQTPNAAASPFGAQSSQIQMNNNINEPKPVSATPPPVISTPQSPGNTSVQSSKSSGSTAMDLLGDLGGDPFASSTPQTQSTGGFADFGNFGNTGSQSNSGFPTPTQSAGFPPATQQTSQPTPFPQSTPLQPLGSTSSSSNSQTMNGSVAPPAPAAGGDKYSNLSDLFSMATTTESEPATSTGWGLSSTNTSGGINWSSGGTAPPAGGINWGGDSSSTSNVGGVNWNSSSSSQSSASNTGVGWGGASTSNVASTGMSTMSWGGAPATAQSNGLGTPGNPFLQQNSASNPFGVSSGTSLSTQSSMGTAGASNPFGGQALGAQQGGFGGQMPGAQQGGFGGQVQGTQGGFGGQVPGAQQGGFGSQAGGFGQFGAQQNTAGVNSTPGQFGQFSGMQNGTGYGAMPSAGAFGNASTSTQAGFRQPGQQQFAAQPGFGQQQAQGVGGFGAMPASGFGAQSAGFGQPGFGGQPQQQQQMAQGFGGWGQQAPTASTANPFMSTVQQYSAAPKSGATNPFL